MGGWLACLKWPDYTIYFSCRRKDRGHTYLGKIHKVEGDKEVKVGCVGREVSLGKHMSTKLYMVAITIMEGHKEDSSREGIMWKRENGLATLERSEGKTKGSFMTQRGDYALKQNKNKK